MGLREFIEELQKNRELTKITKPVSTEYEIAGIINALGEKPVYFEKVKESSYPVVAGLVSSKELICRSMSITKEQLLPKLLSAIEKPIPPQLVEKGACQEVLETDVDLTKLPIMHYTDRDGGKYIASAVSIIKDPELGRNMCFHRLMLKDKKHFIARIVENRGTDTALKKAGGELEIAICLGNSTPVLLAAATTMPMGVDELGMANALEKCLRPQTFAIGVKLFGSKADLPSSIQQVTKALNHKIALCQGFGLARRNRLTLAVFKEDMVCPVGAAVMGLAERPDYVLNGHLGVPRYNRTLEASAATERAMRHFGLGEYEGLVIGPLDDIEFEPDLAMVYVNSVQVSRLIMADLYEKGGRFELSVIPGAVCADALVPPVKEGKCSLGLPCWGERTHAGTNDNELIFSIPASKFSEIASGLTESHNSGMKIPVPLPVAYQAPQPEPYKQYIKDMGLEG